MSLSVVVLDRDGTLIEDRHYINKTDDVVFYPGAIQALKDIRSKGYPLFLVSNQSGVGRGLISDDDFQKVHRCFVDALKEHAFEFDQIAYCFHAPEENCPCRKPGVGLVPGTYRGVPIDWSRSYVVGDHVPDMGLASALGAAPCLVLTGKGAATREIMLSAAHQMFASVVEFAHWLPVSRQTHL